jgi:hypothetical protein
MIGDKLLLQFVEKCKGVLCHDGCTIFLIAYKHNKLLIPEKTSTPCLTTSVVNNFCGHGKPLSPFLWLFFGLHGSSTVMRVQKSHTIMLKLIQNGLESKHLIMLLIYADVFGNLFSQEISNV